MDTGIRVWSVFRYYYPNFAGTAIQGRQILRQLAGQGFDIRILAAADHLATDKAGREIENEGLIVRYLPVVGQKDWSFLAKNPFLQKLARYLNRLISGLSFNLAVIWVLWREGELGDIVHWHSFSEFSFLGERIARMRGMHPVILMTLLGSDDPSSIRERRRGILGGLKLAAFREAEAVVSLCSAQTNSCRDAGVDMQKVVQIPCAVDLQRFHPLDNAGRMCLREKLGLRRERRYIVFVGSAQARKGIDILIRAFVSVAWRFDDVELLVVGPCDFSDRTRYGLTHKQLIVQLKTELSQAGFSSRVHWVGSVEDVYEYLQVADIFCLPTRREGFGIAIAEAMAVGLPVVVACIEGVTTDHVHPGREGILVIGYGLDDYAGAMLQLLSDPGLMRRMGCAARTRAASEFALGIITHRFACLYGELAGGTSV